MDIPILVTKLHVPPRRPELVSRPRLLARLNEGLRRQRRLTLVSAPAGYGKTTLAADWLHAQADARTAWLSLDEADNDPQRFLRYVLAAVQRVDPTYGAGARSLLQGPQSAGGQACLTLLLNDLAAASDPLILILDDYHLIDTPAVHGLVDFTLEHAPATFHLMLLTRQDPPLALSRLRARGQLTELRAADLRFTSQEVATFFRETLGLALNADAIDTLATRTEGWIASLQLAGMALQTQEEKDAFLEQFSGSHRYVIDYLLDEVLRHQPPEVRAFLTHTSILERLCAPLCDALRQGADPPAADILRDLETANLFLVPLDDHRTWYRYHHLFADALRSDLAPTTAQALHRRAAGWFAAHDLRAEAIRHALAAGDFTTAAGWIEAASGPLLRNGRMVTLLGWLDALPEPVIGQYPELAATKAMALLLTGQVEAVEAYVADLERTDAAQEPALRGRLFALHAWLANAQGERGEMEAAEAALELLPETATLFRILALIPLSHARMNAGDLTGSTRALRDAYRLAEAAEQHFAGLGALANLVFNLLEQGARREALALCREALARHVDADGRPLPALGLVYLPLSKAHYLGDDLDQAERYAREGLDLCRTLFSGTMAGGDAEQVLAQVYFARGEPKAAFALLEEAYQAAHRQGITPVAQSLRSAEALLRLRQGELDAVARWLDSLGRPIPSWARRAHLAWLLAARRWEEAESLLREWAEQLTAREQFGRLISVRLMQAQAAAGQGRRAEALRDLEEAVARAAPEGYRRFFLDAPAEVQMLLPHVRGAAPDFVDDLLARSEFDFPAPREVPEPLIEPLSEREREVLGLIAAGLSNREIAEQLFITVGTVKRHAHNLYGKLEVSSRTEAVARARELGLL